MTRKGAEVLGFEKVPPVKVGDLVTCTECDGVGWVRRLVDVLGQYAQFGYGHKRQERRGPPVLCPVCKGERKVQVLEK